MSRILFILKKFGNGSVGIRLPTQEETERVYDYLENGEGME